MLFIFICYEFSGDENRFRLLEDRKPGSSDYINAVFLNVSLISLRTVILNSIDIDHMFRGLIGFSIVNGCVLMPKAKTRPGDQF